MVIKSHAAIKSHKCMLEQQKLSEYIPRDQPYNFQTNKKYIMYPSRPMLSHTAKSSPQKHLGTPASATTALPTVQAVSSYFLAQNSN